MTERKNQEILFEAIKTKTSNGRFVMNNPGLLMFYLTGFMKESVYRLPEDGGYAVAQIKDGRLVVHEIIGQEIVDIDSVASAFGSGISWVELGFTPFHQGSYTMQKWHEEDTTLFIQGKDLELVGREKMMFPTLSHA